MGLRQAITTRNLNVCPSAKAVIVPSKHLAQSSSALNSARYFVSFAHIPHFSTLLFSLLGVISDHLNMRIHLIYLTECTAPLRTSFLRVNRTEGVGERERNPLKGNEVSAFY